MPDRDDSGQSAIVQAVRNLAEQVAMLETQIALLRRELADERDEPAPRYRPRRVEH